MNMNTWMSLRNARPKDSPPLPPGTFGKPPNGGIAGPELVLFSGMFRSGAFDQTTFEAGEPYVLGTLSRGPQTEDQCLAAIYTRTDAHSDMIIAAGKSTQSEPVPLKPRGR